MNENEFQKDKVAARAMRRYRDGYIVARTINVMGAVVKSLGLFLGITIIIACIIIGSQERGNAAFIVGGFILGPVVAVSLYVRGVLVSAQGQFLKATMDDAVHSSPFMSDAQKASVMSLTSDSQVRTEERPHQSGPWQCICGNYAYSHNCQKCNAWKCSQCGTVNAAGKAVCGKCRVSEAFSMKA